jgi:hypothetical protein
MITSVIDGLPAIVPMIVFDTDGRREKSHSSRASQLVADVVQLHSAHVA